MSQLTSGEAQQGTESEPAAQPALKVSLSRLSECENRAEGHESKNNKGSEISAAGSKEGSYLGISECAMKELRAEPLNEKEL